MKLFFMALILCFQAPVAFAKKCDVDLEDFKDNHLEFEYAISPDEQFYEILGSNISGTKAIITSKFPKYGDFSSLYNYVESNYNYPCPRAVDVSLLKGFNGVSHIDINGTFIKRMAPVILSDKTKGIYLGKTLDGDLVLNKLRSYRGNKISSPQTLLLVSDTTDLDLFLVDRKYSNCSTSKMAELVEEKTRSKYFYGKNTEKLMRKCEKKGFSDCISGEFNRKVSTKFSLATYLECKAKVHPYQKHACKAYATSNKVSSKSGVLGIEFQANEFFQDNPDYCSTLKKCSESTNDKYELGKFGLINKKLRCY